MQKDLSEEIKKASKALQNDYDTDYKIRNIYDNIRQNLEKDFLNKHKRNRALLEQIDEKNSKRAELWQLFLQYKNKNNKKFYKYNKELKELNAEILSLIDLAQKEQNEIKNFDKKLGAINNSANEPLEARKGIGFRRFLCGITTKVAPQSNVQKISCILKSKVMSKNCEILSWGVKW